MMADGAYLLQILHSVTAHWELGIENIYTMEIGKHYKSALLPSSYPNPIIKVYQHAAGYKGTHGATRPAFSQLQGQVTTGLPARLKVTTQLSLWGDSDTLPPLIL